MTTTTKTTSDTKRVYDVTCVMEDGTTQVVRVQIQNTKAAKDKVRREHPVESIKALKFVPNHER